MRVPAEGAPRSRSCAQASRAGESRDPGSYGTEEAAPGARVCASLALRDRFTRPGHAASSSDLCSLSSVLEHPVALQVDDLFGFRDRERDRVLLAVMGVGADEAVLLHAGRRILFDDAGGLVDAARFIRSRPNAIAFVFDRRTWLGCLLFGCARARKPSPPSFELGKHANRRS
jgi:hypothetical protein